MNTARPNPHASRRTPHAPARRPDRCRSWKPSAKPAKFSTRLSRSRGRFVTILDELCGELMFCAARHSRRNSSPTGPIARRMVGSRLPYRHHSFITPMAAVAGAVAEEILDAMTIAANSRRAYVNDGGDIALHLAPEPDFVVGMVERPERPSLFWAQTLFTSDSPFAASPPAAGAAAAFRSASRMRSRFLPKPPQWPTLPPPSSPMLSICRAIPASCAFPPANLRQIAILAIGSVTRNRRSTRSSVRFLTRLYRASTLPRSFSRNGPDLRRRSRPAR